MANRAQLLYRFGEFTLLPDRRSVHRGGEPLPLTAKAFDLLLYMVENPGRVLMRDELLHAVWGDVVVEDRNLNQTVFTIRKALSEAEEIAGNDAKYIQTIPGKGYQFVAPVEQGHQGTVERFRQAPAANAPQPVIVSSAAIPLPHREEASSQPPPLVLIPTRRRRMHGMTFVVAAVVLPLLAGFLCWRYFRPVSAQRIEVVMAKMDNQTGDSTFDTALNRALEIDLQQSPSLVLVSDSRTRAAISDMQQDPAKTGVTSANAREVCQRVNGNAALLPSIATVGGKYMLAVSALNCETGDLLGGAKEVVADKAGILEALDHIGDKMRRFIGESPASLRRYNLPLQRAETPSLEALKVWTQGEEYFHTGELDKAVPLFQHAVEIDPNFAVAWCDLGSAYRNLKKNDDMIAATTRAYQLRDRATERYRYYIEGRYWAALGDPAKAMDVLRRWTAEYPNDMTPMIQLTDQETWTGNPAMASQTADKVMRILRSEDLHNAFAYEIVLRAYVYNREFAKARSLCNLAEQQKRYTPGAQGLCLMAAVATDDQREEARIVAASRGTDSEVSVLGEEALANLRRGKVRQAGDLLKQAQAAAEKSHSTEDLLTDQATYVRMLAELGLTQLAQQSAAALPHDDDSMDLGFMRAMVDEPPKVSQEADAALQAHPGDVLVARIYVPQMRAELQLRAGKPQDAIQTLQPNIEYSGRDGTEPYLMGQALLQDGKYGEASASFARLTVPGFVDEPLTPLPVLAHLESARAFAKEGNVPAATEQYDKFLTIYKDADADLPVLAQARAELASLPATRK